LREVMLASAELVRVEVERSGLSLNLDLPSDELYVVADQRRLRQVILNLISNAIKYNSPDGQITMTYQIAGQHTRIIVEDTGMGIGAELQGQLFQPFQRLGRENTAILGTGLGLSLCREFAELMGGHMGVNSHPGIGSSFWIELPMAPSKPPMASAPVAEPVLPAETRPLPRVFVVEDDPASQFLVKKALEGLASIEVIADGREALARIIDSPPNLLLLDINLPGISGEEVLRVLRSNSGTRSVKVIVLSGVVGHGQMQAMDCQGFLAKPLDGVELRRLVGAVLNN